MQLVVTEKPSVAQAISHVIGAKERKDGYMEGNGFLVSWCVGHLVELAQPEMYSEAWKKWSYESLPMIPEQWQHEVKKETATQYKILKNLMHDTRVESVVCATDIEQQEGRILRQGNRNPKVKIFRYVTEGTFDSYSWQLIENKQKFIGQIMTSKSPVRSCEDVDEAALSYAEVKALATGNPYIKEKMDLDIQVSKLKLMKANHTSQKYRLEDNIAKHYPQQITILKERISGLQADIQTAKTNLPADKEFFSMRVGNKVYTDKKEAGTALVEMCKEIKSVNAPAVIGEYAGFKMAVSFDSFNHKFVMNIKGQLSHNLEIGVDPLGNISRINHALEAMTKELAEASTKLENVERQLETAKVEVTKPFAQEAELSEKLDRLSALNALLNMDEKGDDGIGMEDDKSELGTEQVADTRKPYPIENTRHNYAVENGNPQGMRLTAAMADKPAQRVSLKEKLETMKVKAAGNNIENSVQRDKGKEEYL